MARLNVGTLLTTLALLVSGAAGIALARLLRIPGGDLLGAMTAAAIVTLLNPATYGIPGEIRVLAQIMVGALIGSQIRPGALAGLRPVAGRVLLLSLALILAGFGTGALFSLATGLSLPAGLLALLPGGAADVAAVALELGDEAPIVVGVQGLRQLLVLGVLGVAFRVGFSGKRRSAIVRMCVVEVTGASPDTTRRCLMPARFPRLLQLRMPPGSEVTADAVRAALQSNYVLRIHDVREVTNQNPAASTGTSRAASSPPIWVALVSVPLGHKLRPDSRWLPSDVALEELIQSGERDALQQVLDAT